MEPVQPGGHPPGATEVAGWPPAWLIRLTQAKVSATLFVAAAAAFVLCWHDPGTATLRAPFSSDVVARYGALTVQAVREGEVWRFRTRPGQDSCANAFPAWLGSQTGSLDGHTLEGVSGDGAEAEPTTPAVPPATPDGDVAVESVPGEELTETD